MNEQNEAILLKIKIPYKLKGTAQLEAAFPMTETDWERMMAVLTTMKPSLVLPKEEPKPVEEKLIDSEVKP